MITGTQQSTNLPDEVEARERLVRAVRAADQLGAEVEGHRFYAVEGPGESDAEVEGHLYR